jgi:DNA-binding ferritin-like protein
MEVLFIKFNYIDMLNQYLTNIFITKNNLYNLYFNTRGEGSSSIKNNLLNDIKQFNNMYIKLSLLIKKIGGFPIMNLSEIEKISTIKQISSKDYTLDSSIKIILNDLKIINSMNNQVGEYSLKNFDFKSINLILEFNKYLENRLQELNSN